MRSFLLLSAAVFATALPQSSAPAVDIKRATSAIRLMSIAYCSPAAITSKSCRTCGAVDLQALQNIVADSGSDLNWYSGYVPYQNCIQRNQ
jgi:hypothetical protein